jgi:hypothetical protein
MFRVGFFTLYPRGLCDDWCQSFNMRWSVVRDTGAVLRGWLAAHFLVMRALLLGHFPAFSTMVPLFTESADSSIDATVPPERLQFRFEPRPSVSAQFAIDVALDEEFRVFVGEDWQQEVRRIIDSANQLLGQRGISAEVGSARSWRSDDLSLDAPSLLAEASRQVPRDSGHAFLAVTGQAAKPLDGWSRRLRTSAITRYYRYDQAMTAALIAHEVGHVLGAIHHEDGHICEDGACIMNGAGFARSDFWCDEHVEQIWESITSGLSAGAA